MTVLYAPATSGGWLAAACGQRAIVVGGEVDASLVSDLWQAITQPSGFQLAMDVLVRGGFGALPPFALIDVSASGARVIVRGGVGVAVGTRTLSGEGVSTWSEQLFDGAESVAVSVAGAVGSSLSLPLDAGAALVASLVVGAASQAVQPQAAVAAPAPTTVPAPKQTVVEIDEGATVTEAPTVDVQAPATAPSPTSEGYDYLFGETMYRDVADAAVHDEPVQEPGQDAVVGDHDGQTVLTADVAKLRAARKSRRTPAPPPAPPAAPTLVLVLSNGAREPLEQPILVGRSPSVSQVSGGQIPRLLTIGTADQDISRTHARFALEGGTVVVTDLHSRNGTQIVLPGKEPQKLRAGEPTALLVGTVVDFGGGVTVTVDEDA